jgi:hypothetical protein
MSTALHDFHALIHNPVNQTVFIIYSSAPVSPFVMFQGFWLADARVSIAKNVLQKRIDAAQDFLSCPCQYR